MADWSSINDFLGSEDETVKSTAAELQGYIKSYDNEELTIAEFRNLSEDLLDVTKIDAAVVGLERQIIIKEAFEAMLTIASSIQ